MSALVIFPSGCLDDDAYDQQVDATESHTPEAGKDDAPELIDVSNVTDEPQPAEEPVVQTTIASTSGRSGSGSSSSSSSSPDVSRVVTSGDYTEPTGTIIGNLTITGATTGTITLPIGLTVNGNLIVNTPDATVYNYATVGGNINIIAVSVNTWNQYGNAGSIQMGATNATFYFFSGNITQGISLINPCNVVIGLNATGLPQITLTEDAEGSDINNLGSEELEVVAGANVTVTGNVTVTFANQTDLDSAIAVEALLIASDYVDYSAVTAALALPETTNAEVVAKTTAINDAIGALVLQSVIDAADSALFASSASKEAHTLAGGNIGDVEYVAVEDAETALNGALSAGPQVQGDIETATADLNDAISALELATAGL